MALKDLSDLDFSYYKDYSDKMRTCHEKEFLECIDPELLRMMYRGKNKKQSKDRLYDVNDNKREHLLTYSRLFQATNTVLPNLMYQMPRNIVLNRKDPRKGAITAQALNQSDIKLNQKRENQEAVMNAWFFGLGWKKMGYYADFVETQSQSPEDQPSQESMMDKMKQGMMSMMGVPPKQKIDNLEHRESAPIAESEGLFNTSESPLNIMLDHKADFLNKRAMLHRLPRTLYNLKNNGNYDATILQELTEKMQHKHGSRFDDREIDLDLNELHILQRNGIWILTWIDQHNKPLRYELAQCQGKGFQFEGLTLTNEPGVRYPTSHFKIAAQQQEHLDYLATLYVKILDRTRNQLLVHENDLATGMKQALERNKFGGIIYTKKPITQATFAQLTSAAVQSDLPNFMGLLQQNVTEILGADEQAVAGRSTNKTLGQDELARAGSQIRESGMQDKVREWLINQKRKETYLMQHYSMEEMKLNVSPQDYAVPEGQPEENEQVEYMTQERPVAFKDEMKDEIFENEMNIYEAVKPDKQTLMKEYSEAMALFSQPQVAMALEETGSIVRIDLIAEAIGEQFEYIDTKRFVEKLDSMQLAARQAKRVIMQNGGMVPQPKITPVPKSQEASIQ